MLRDFLSAFVRSLSDRRYGLHVGNQSSFVAYLVPGSHHYLMRLSNSSCNTAPAVQRQVSLSELSLGPDQSRTIRLRSKS